MAVTKTYARPKATPTNASGMVFSLAVAEGPGVPVVLASDSDDAGVAAAAGNSGNLKAELSVDVDESGGTTMKKLFRWDTVLSLGSDVGAVPQVITTVTPINPDGSDNTALAKQITMAHPLSMDSFQAAAGRARQ